MTSLDCDLERNSLRQLVGLLGKVVSMVPSPHSIHNSHSKDYKCSFHNKLLSHLLVSLWTYSWQNTAAPCAFAWNSLVLETRIVPFDSSGCCSEQPVHGLSISKVAAKQATPVCPPAGMCPCWASRMLFSHLMLICSYGFRQLRLLSPAELACLWKPN